MGSIRSSNVKRTAETLVAQYPGKFTKSYGENRVIVKQVVTASSKKTLNNIAGYVTRYMLKLESRRKKEEEETSLPA
ncbi:30S ribosomal protein S17e [mine drainage metagenome]|uniref:30S ribosomal protein S17e n=2 Tax=mine drainage metagenome TaxID=410659 RepID=T1ANX6_9ZZZZ